MHDFSLTLANMPQLRVADRERAVRGLQRWREAAGAAEPAAAAVALAAIEDPRGRALLEGLFGGSPFLGGLLLAEFPFATELFRAGVQPAIDRVLTALAEPRSDRDKATLMSELRVARRRIALAVAVADIAGLWPLPQITGALSAFAELAVRLATAHLLRAAHDAGEIRLPYPDEPARASGYVLIAMGKLGAGELNYSSDIDLIALYDRERVRYEGRRTVQDCFVRMTQGLVRILQDRTAEGYVFRVDLRLRPDPASTPPALSVRAAETYYESMGQNWERAAMIKARPLAGDVEVGAAFLAHLRPYVWRKNLDFAAIRDIHSIKRQIHVHKGHKVVAVGGHNIKLGRGGIREIEFFAQTQQLIWGGRIPGLRVADTRGALHALSRAGRIGDDVAQALTEAYEFLRGVEHRLQMVEDRQTQTLPLEGPALEGFARFLGYADAAAFSARLVAGLRRVESIYAELFEEQPALVGSGNLVFTGTEADPETVKTLERMGFTDGSAVSASIRAWHHGRYRATRSTRARELLTELMPRLLESLARTGSPDVAFARFDAFLANLPTGVPLFAMIHANPGLLDLIALILGGAPRLAEQLSRTPQLLDAVLTPGFNAAPAQPAAPASELAANLGHAADYQEVLDSSRRWVNHRKFQIGVAVLTHACDADAGGRALSDLADAALNGVHPHVERSFAEQYGRLPGPGLAVVALGKLGGREMTVTSDLDLVFLYEADPGAASDGGKKLPAAHYYARLSQRLINAYTAPTEEGRLYEVDMRLRPSGTAGPIASQLAGFLRYQEEEAWTWEHLALTRARVVVAEPQFRNRIAAAIRRVLVRPRDPVQLAADVAAMRERMGVHLRPGSIWDVKHIQGGLVEVEFVAQYLILRHASRYPAIASLTTASALRALARHGLLGAEDARQLLDAGRLWRSVQGYLRLTTGSEFDEAAAPEPLRNGLARAGEAIDFTALRQKMVDTAERVHEIYDRIVVATGAPRRRNEGGEGI